MKSWLSEVAVPYPEQQFYSQPELKWPAIPALNNYREAPSEAFWENFPKKELPLAPATAVNKPALRDLLISSKSKLTVHQYRRGSKVLEDLRTGASAAQNIELPPTTVKNASSAFENGRMLTDKIAS